MSKWEKLSKEFDDILYSMTKEDWDNWYENVEMKRIKQNNMTEDQLRDERDKWVIWGGNPDMNNTVTGNNPDTTMSPTDVENERFKHNASGYNPAVREKDNTTGETTIEFPRQHQPEPYNPNRPSLDTITFKFEQEENCVDGGEGETLIVEAKSSLGIDGDGGAFYVLKTEQWAVSEIDELIVMLKRVEAALNATKPTSIHV